MDLSKVYNPYDFGNPVSDVDLFVGRRDELGEIRYYLDHARSAPRPINLALLGQRASGKTSLLNIIALEARKRDQCVVRIDLDEDDVKSQMRFFYKVFDSIFNEVCQEGAFGGKGGRTFDIYLDIVSAYAIPSDKTFCPFTFPIQFAKAMASRNEDMLVSDVSYKRDLSTIRTEVAKPIILLFDEGNVLANSRSLLEKLRNTFMNTPGFMLVVTGTPNLFPVIDEVFSPIVRQFKKINVGEFKDEDETSACIRKPLEKIGLKPDEIFDFDTINEVEEIHNLSSGRPYEIQLICFMMFKRVQEKRASKMMLDLSILEEVRRELETSQDISARPVLTKIRSLDERQLRALKLLCSCNGHATLEQIWSIEFIFKGNKRWTFDGLKESLSYLEREGIVSRNGDEVIRFTGDDFDKIYIKYFASEQGMLIDIEEQTLEIYWFVRQQIYLNKFKGLRLVPEIIPASQTIDLEEFGAALAAPDNVDIFVEDRFITRILYELMIAYHDVDSLPLVQVTLALPPINGQLTYFATGPQAVPSIDSSLQGWSLLASRAEEVGGKLVFKRVDLKVVSIEHLAQKVDRTANENFRVRLAQFHAAAMEEAYIRKKQPEEAFLHAQLSIRYNPEPAVFYENNIGYTMLSHNQLEVAKNLFERHRRTSFGFERSLSTYNLAVTELKLNNVDRCFTLLEEAKELASGLDKRKRTCACLFLPKLDAGEVSFEEETGDVDLYDITCGAEENLRPLKEREPKEK